MNNALFWGAYCWCSVKFKIGHFFTKSRLTKLLQCEISQKFTKHFQILILWVQRKGFKDDIQTFWLSWHDSPGNSRGIWWGTSEVPPLSGSFKKKDSLVRVKGCNNIGGKSRRSEKKLTFWVLRPRYTMFGLLHAWVISDHFLFFLKFILNKEDPPLLQQLHSPL